MDLGAEHRRHTWFYVVFSAFIVAHAALVWIPRVYPIVDLPFRLASAEILRHVADPGSRLAGYYAVDWSLKPNILYPLVCSWSVFPSVEIANKAFLVWYVVSVPVLVLLIIRKLGGNVWFSLLSFLLIYNFSFSWGFTDYLMAIPLVLLTFYVMLGYLRHGGTWRGIAIAFLLTFSFFAHVLAMLFGILVFTVCCAYRGWKSRSDTLRDLAVVTPALGLFAAWCAMQTQYGKSSTAEFLLNYYKIDYWQSISGRLRLPVADNRHLFGGVKGLALAAGLSLPIIIPALWWLIRSWRGLPSRTDPRPVNYTLVLGACALAMWLLFPENIPGNVLLYQRFAAFVMLSLVMLGSQVNWRMPRAAAQSCIVGVILIHLLLHADYFYQFERASAAFTAQSLPGARERVVMSGLVYDSKFRGLPAYMHWPNYYIVWKHGIACTSLVDFRFGIIRRGARRLELPKYDEWLYETGRYDGRYCRATYILARGRIPRSQMRYLRGFAATKLGSGWELYMKPAAR